MTRAAACGGEHRSAARCYEFGVGADSCGSRPDYSATGEAGKRFEEKEGAVAGTRENGAGEVQGAFGSGEAVAGARVDSGGAEADRRVFDLLKKKRKPLLELEKTVLERCKAHLEAEKPLRELELTPEERKPIGGFLFLSQRPMLYVLNLGDDEAAELSTAVERHKLSALEGRPNTAVVAICGRLEAELAEMDDKEATELLASYGLKEPGLNRLIRATYDLMGLLQYFTAGEPEVRAWTIRKGATAVKAAGEIHSDIEKGFIRAEVVRWNDLLAAGSIAAAREKAQVRLEGRDYIVQEGDVILFRHSG